MSTLSKAIDVYAELYRLGLAPRIKNGRMIMSGEIPQELLALIPPCKDDLARIFQAVDEPIPGICDRCRKYTQRLFKVHMGEVCTACLDELLTEAGYIDEETNRD